MRLLKQNHGVKNNKLGATILINEFQEKYPRFSITPLTDDFITLKGIFYLNATFRDNNQIIDSYKLEIRVPCDYPKSTPVVFEIDDKIPKKSEYHVNSDGSLCLGTPLRLKQIIHKEPSLISFADNLLVPYLYAVSNKLRGGSFILGELDHGKTGELADYEDIFCVKGDIAVQNCLLLLSSYKKRIANKKACPCNCGKKLGKCKTHLKLNVVRKTGSKKVFKQILDDFLRRS